MMRQELNLHYCRGGEYQSVLLPYKGGDFAMTILLPDSGRFREFEDSLNEQATRETLDGLEYELVHLTMPKFEVASSFRLLN